MSETLKQEIDRLKSELDQMELAFKRQELLLRKREELEIEIEKLDHSRAFEEKAQLLKMMKNKRQEIDNSLDAIEENIEESILNLRTGIKQKMLLLYPEKEESYAQLSTEMERIKREKLFLQEISFQIETLLSILSKALEARQKIKRLGLLSYLFGENPTDVISMHLKGAETQAKLLLDLINEQNANHTALLQFLSAFQEETQKRWGFKRMDTIFIDAEKQLQGFLKENEEKLKQTKESLKQQQEALEKLLE